MSAEPKRTCPSCGNEFSGAMEFCPVCMLRKGLGGGVESGESSSEEAAKPTREHAEQRFEHYELVTGEDGPVPENAFHKARKHGRAVFPSHYGCGWQCGMDHR